MAKLFYCHSLENKFLVNALLTEWMILNQKVHHFMTNTLAALVDRKVFCRCFLKSTLCLCFGDYARVRGSCNGWDSHSWKKKIHCTAELFFFPENSSYIYVQSLTRKWIQLSIQDCGLELYDTWCSVSYIIIHRVWQCGININIDVSIGKCIYANLFTLGVGLLFYLYWKFSAKS